MELPPAQVSFPSHFRTTIVTDPFTKPDIENDPAYIFNVCVSPDGSILAATSSTNVVKVYDMQTHALIAHCSGHQSTITDAYFAANGALFTSSLDGTVKMWDPKSSKCLQTFHAGSELFSVHQGGPGGVALAAGGTAKVFVWDLRNGKQAACYQEAHTEDVTQVKFHPNGTLFTASQDGLVCMFDISQPDEDEAYQSTLNVDQPINKIGFFGKNAELLYALTSGEQMQVWSLTDDRKVADFGPNFRDELSASNNIMINYFIDCKYNHATDQLLLLAGSMEGQGYVFLMSDKTATLIAKLENGHTSIIRDLYLSMDGSVAVTGGEDSKISFWSQSNSSSTSAQSGRSPSAKFNDGHRHRPY